MKDEDWIKISDPEIVFQKFHKDHQNAGICFSTRKDKKYMILHPDTNKFIHFGSTMSDYTKHKYTDKYTPAYLSDRYLW